MISVHIITGFLGVGKTTLVKNLISQKPESESWAIIVNEFGELGVDALLLEAPSVTISQVPGGCACCAANLPFQVSLNKLLKSQSFDRILIEPSGLGHGDKLAELLEEDQYKEWLTLDGVITLIDPEQFQQPKYRNHEIYIRQLQVADAIVISKSDLATESNIAEVKAWATSSKLPFLVAKQGYINLQDVSEIKRKPRFMLFKPMIKDDNGYDTQGIQFSSTTRFDYEKMISFLKKSGWVRVKGYINTNQGWYQINMVNNVFEISSASPHENNILEIIHDEPLTDRLESDLSKLLEPLSNES